MSSNADNSYENMGEAVLDELDRRLSNPEEARDLPGTLLMNLAKDYLKYKQEKLALERAKLEEKKLDPLSMIDQPGLGKDRRIAILAEFLADVEDVWRRASTRMEELLSDGNPGEVPEVSDVVSEA